MATSRGIKATRIGGALIAGSTILGCALFVPFGATSAFGVSFGQKKSVAESQSMVGVQALVLHSRFDATIRGDDSVAEPTIRLLGTVQGVTPTFEVQEDAGNFRVTAHCDRWLFLGSRCNLRADIVVPTGTSVNLFGSSGDVAISQISKQVTARTSSGDIAISDVSGAVEANTASGDITTTDVTSIITTKASSGSVLIKNPGVNTTILARSSAGDITVDSAAQLPNGVDVGTSAGGISVTLPQDAEMNIDAQGTTGEVLISVKHNPNSPNRLRAKSASGTIRLTSVTE